MQRILGIITIAGLSAACVAKPAQQQEWQAGGGGKSTISMQSNDGKDSYEIRIQDGKITAKRNGEEVPADRIVKTKDGDREVIEIHDENGAVVKTFDMTTVSGHRVHIAPITTTLAPTARGKVYTSTSAPKAHAGFRADDGNVAVAAPDTMENPPPVMVGVTMAEPDEGVLEFLKLEKAVVFDRVIDDLPAAKAGLKAGDILVEVKGEKNINQERFREILRGMKAGDSLPIKIARSGAEMHDFTISLAAFDAKLLGRAEPKDNNGETWDVFTNKDSKKSWESAHKALEEAMAKLKTEVKSEEAQKAVREALEKAIKSVEEAKDSLRDVQLWSNGGQWAPQGSTRFRLSPGKNGGLMVPPPTITTPAVPDVDDERIQKLEKKVDDLNKKLDKIAKLLEERK